MRIHLSQRSSQSRRPWVFFDSTTSDPCSVSGCDKSMKCDVCGNPPGICKYNKGKHVCSFYIQLRSKCDLYMTVPCFARKQVNEAMGNTMPVQTEQDVYMFDLDKRSYKTHIHGDQYNQFLKEYQMQPYDKVRIEFVENSQYLMMQPLDKEGSHKERVEGYVFEETTSAIVFSKGVDPTKVEMANINNVVLTRGIGLGTVFVHRLAVTDINHNGLRITKHIVSLLNIEKTGTSYLVLGDEGFIQKAQYYPAADGRLRFKNGWADFAKMNDLKAGMMVLMLFELFNDDLQISFDIVGN